MTDSAIPDLQTWKVTLSYDGTDYRGWQIQPGQPTVQGELQEALGRVTGEAPLPQGSGRTDAGVHALGQVASFELSAPIPAENLLRALNRTLPSTIRILGAKTMPAGFHARHSASAKTYEYRVWIERRECVDICPPFLSRYVYVCPWILDQEALQSAAADFLGEHDFASFAASEPDLSTRSQKSENTDEGADEDCASIHNACSLLLVLASAADRRRSLADLPDPRKWVPASHGAQPGGNHDRGWTPRPRCIPISLRSSLHAPVLQLDPQLLLAASSSTRWNTGSQGRNRMTPSSLRLPGKPPANLRSIMVLFSRSTAFARVTALAAKRQVHAAFAWMHNNPRTIMDWQAKLVAIPAPPFGEEARAAWVADRFIEAGLVDVKTDVIGNVIGMLPAAHLPADSSGHVIVLSAHLDTVFPAETPLNPQVREIDGYRKLECARFVRQRRRSGGYARTGPCPR